MCHGSGGVAGKYAFGARTPVANLVLGVAYVAVALGAVGLVVTYPLSMLGVILVLVALQLAHTSLQHTTHYPVVVLVGLVGVLVDVGVAFVAGVALHLVLERVGR
jgi:MFS superfamily sulfate permease-like transporter